MSASQLKADCVVCGRRKWTLLYEGKIRDGSFGKLTTEPMRIYQCAECGLARLDEFVIGQREYESTLYREKYNDSSDDKVLLKMHDPEQGPRIALVGLDKFRDKVVLDYGCGHGALLDAVAGVAKQTIGIEPLRAMHDSLENRGHTVFGSSEHALQHLRGKVQVLTSFGVIEHVEDPRAYLRNAFDLLEPGALFILQTDNIDDVLLKTEAQNFVAFFYRTAHNWYFRRSNLESLAVTCGFVELDLRTFHSYDFSNFVLWHRDGRPTGTGKLRLFDSVFDQLWKAVVEASGYGDLITMVGRKPSV